MLTDPSRRRFAGALVGVIVGLIALIACGELPPPDPPVRVDSFDLVSTVPIAGAQIDLEREPGTTIVSVTPLQADVLADGAAYDGTVRLAWIGATAVAGPQVRVTLERVVATPTPPVVRSVRALNAANGADLGESVLLWRDAGDPVPLDPPLAGLEAVDAAVELEPGFASYVFGDLNQDGALDVRDAMLLLARMQAGTLSPHQRYHGDATGDDTVRLDDLVTLLARIVDPTLPASLQVKPTALSFLRLDPGFTSQRGVVLIANAGRAAFSDLDWPAPMRPKGIEVAHVGGVPGQSAALDVTLPASNRRGWLPGTLSVLGGGNEASVRLGNVVVLIAGQSNASGRGAPSTWPHTPDPSVRMLANDYVWRDAQEPLDDATGQLDTVSKDDVTRYSFGTHLGERLRDATGFNTYLIPAAKGGTQTADWLPPEGSLDTETLFGSASIRGLVSAGLRENPVVQVARAEGGPVNALVWYQGESNADSRLRRDAFISDTNKVMNGFDDVLGAPVIYVQLASQHDEEPNVKAHRIAELQRRMESDGFHMVVAFDLPRSDSIHLSAFGQRVLSERIELALREHVFGEAVDGTGPRLTGISHSGTMLRVHTTRTLDPGALDPTLFTVFDGSPGDIDDLDIATYGANFIPITSVVRDPADPTTVLITLEAPVNSGPPHVRYMAQPNRAPSSGNNTPSDPGVWELLVSGTVKDAASGLPLPTFGPLPPF